MITKAFMKRTIYIIVACITLAACELETSNNGKLDGNWQLRQIDTLSTGGTTDMSHSYIYWAVENHLLQVRDIDDSNLTIFFQFEKAGSQLTIQSPYKVVTKDQLEAIEDEETLRPFGIVGLQDTFQFEELSGKVLTLKNQFYRLHFRRY
jgi:hypothetical protein